MVAVASPALSPTLDSLDGSALVTALEVLEGRIHTFEGLKIKVINHSIFKLCILVIFRDFLGYGE